MILFLNSSFLFQPGLEVLQSHYISQGVVSLWVGFPQQSQDFRRVCSLLSLSDGSSDREEGSEYSS